MPNQAPWIIYHNPRCSKSRQTLDILRDAGLNVQIIEYLKTPPSKNELQRLAILLGLKPKDMLRKNEAVITEENLDVNSDEVALDAMQRFPQLLERPIVVHGDQAVLGRPPENVHRLIDA